MNVGLIAHESKKNCGRISALRIGESSANTHFMRQEPQED